MIVSIIIALGSLLLFVQLPSTPFDVGTPVNDVWSYIHTNAVSDGFAAKILPVNKRTRWMADITTIQSETRFSWHQKPFAIQKTVYAYTNGTVTGANTNWEIKWPF